MIEISLMDSGLFKCLERGADWLRGAQFQSYYSDFLLFQCFFFRKVGGTHDDSSEQLK